MIGCFRNGGEAYREHKHVFYLQPVQQCVSQSFREAQTHVLLPAVCANPHGQGAHSHGEMTYSSPTFIHCLYTLGADRRKLPICTMLVLLRRLHSLGLWNFSFFSHCSLSVSVFLHCHLRLSILLSSSSFSYCLSTPSPLINSYGFQYHLCADDTNICLYTPLTTSVSMPHHVLQHLFHCL